MAQADDEGPNGVAAPGRRRSLRSGARRILLALEPVLRWGGLAVRAWRGWETVLTAAGRGRREPQAEDGLALPPAALRVRVIARADAALFMRSGKDEAAIIATACAEHGLPIADSGRMLDFGCGCGRVTRHWSDYSSVEVHGSDHDEDLIGWMRTGLPFVRAHRNELSPPLPYPDHYFGVVYAVSVFTHMTDELSRAWAVELARILRPGGLLLYSALDHRQVDRLRPHERAMFDRGEPVVQFKGALGPNMCVSYHPRAYIEAITPDLTYLSTRRIGAQELNVLRAAGTESQAR